LAITESERVLPKFLDAIDKLLVKHELSKRAPLIRMTGCPNGCARPYSAELGLVGQQAGGKYTVFLGGDFEGTRIAYPYAEKIKFEDIPTLLEKIFVVWKTEGYAGEKFGDFTSRFSASELEAKVNAVTV
jgi:sulfite reductase beta subunit-like hemoprotein